MDDCDGRQKLGSNMFCEIGPASACVADYLEHNAPKSPQGHRLESIILFQQIVNQASKLARCSQICSGHVPVMFRPCFRPCSGRSPDPPERESAFPVRPAQDVMFQKTAFHRLARGMLYEYRLRLPSACRLSCCRVSSSFFPRHPRPLRRPRRSVSEDLPLQIDTAKPAACAERKPSVPLGAVASATGGKVINGEAVWHAQHAAEPATVALAQVESARSVVQMLAPRRRGGISAVRMPLQRPGVASARFAPANRHSEAGDCSVSASRVNAQRCIKYMLHEEGVASLPSECRFSGPAQRQRDLGLVDKIHDES